MSFAVDSSCGTNGVKKSSDELLATQSLFLNNKEHSATLAKSLVRGGWISNQAEALKKAVFCLMVLSVWQQTLIYFLTLSNTLKSYFLQLVGIKNSLTSDRLAWCSLTVLIFRNISDGFYDKLVGAFAIL